MIKFISMIQAILFRKNKWTLKSAKAYLKTKKINYISYRTTDMYYRFRIVEPDYNKYHYKIERNFLNNPNIDYINYFFK